MALARRLEHWIGQRLSLLTPRRRAARRDVRGRARPLEELAGDGRPVVCFDIAGVRLDRDRGRDAHRLISLFRESGHVVAFLDRYPFVSSLGVIPYKKLLLRHDFALVSSLDELPADAVLVTDRRGGAIDKHPGRVLSLRYGAGYAVGEGRLPMPYGPYPRIAEAGEHASRDEVLARRRRWRLFFAGNGRPDRYGKTDLRRNFDKMSRVDVLCTVLTKLPLERQRQVRDAEQLAALGRDEPFNGFVMVDSNDFSIEVDDWLATLADAEFFLACPGVRMPICHNVVEAMSVGTIPVLEYSEHFHPPLKDGEECVRFRGAEDLERQVRRVLELPRDEIERMQRAVLAYHDRHLTAVGFGRRLTETAPASLELHVDAHLSPAREDSAGPATRD